MSEPLAYLITWTCRGTWLRGDDRGSVERTTTGPGIIPPDQTRVDGARVKQIASTVVLNTEERAAVGAAIREVCDRRGWELQACNVRSNHVHVVVRVPGLKPEAAMQQLKAWGTRSIKGTRPEGAVWTLHGSTKYLWDQDSIQRAVVYVRDWQDGARFGA